MLLSDDEIIYLKPFLQILNSKVEEFLEELSQNNSSINFLNSFKGTFLEGLYSRKLRSELHGSDDIFDNRKEVTKYLISDLLVILLARIDIAVNPIEDMSGFDFKTLVRRKNIYELFSEVIQKINQTKNNLNKTQKALKSLGRKVRDENLDLYRTVLEKKLEITHHHKHWKPICNMVAQKRDFTDEQKSNFYKRFIKFKQRNNLEESEKIRSYLNTAANKNRL